LGSLLTAASFLKLGHAAYLGKRNAATENVREASPVMLLPMIVIAGLCVLFGVWNALPLDNLIQPILPAYLLEGAAHHTFAGWPSSMMLIAFTMIVLAVAVINHLVGAKRAGSGLGAADHIHYAPVLATIYDKAEKRWFDPYNIGLKIVDVASWILWGVDRFIDWIYSGLSVGVALVLGYAIRLAHTGQYAMYVIWALMGAVLVVALMTGAL
jgi:hypothetical protein